MIDYHCHILPGLDDGCRDLPESLAMAQVLVTAGFQEVYCTPHCMHGVYDNTPEQVQSAVAELQQQVDREGILLKLHPGMEYYLDEYFIQKLINAQPLGETNLLLIESSVQVDPEQLKNLVFQVARKGYIPLLAHPERYDFLLPQVASVGVFQNIKKIFSHQAPEVDVTDPSLMVALQQQGCQFQGNLGSFAGQYGNTVKQRARQLQQGKFYRFFGSDGHRPEPTARFLEKAKDIY
ncbi:MAG: phosphoesterase [Desulfuromusa sp.]|nr:phosphoesterase [Desulfuromusa sp.]